jgi:hypothetical protein
VTYSDYHCCVAGKGKINVSGRYNFNLDKANNYEVNHFREYEYQRQTFSEKIAVEVSNSPLQYPSANYFFQ